MNITLAILLTFLVACTTSTPIPRDAACHEQADAWCERAGFGAAPGCTMWYVHECEPFGPDGQIDSDAQDACMDAIATNPTPSTEPTACRRTWKGA